MMVIYWYTRDIHQNQVRFAVKHHVARGVRFLLDFRVYPFLIEN